MTPTTYVPGLDIPAPSPPDAGGVRRICDSIRARNRQIEVYGYDGWWSMHVPTELMALVHYAEIGLATVEGGMESRGKQG